jgi:alpha-L-fucosidase
MTSRDIRYTRNKAGTTVYAIALGWPEEEMRLTSLGTAAATKPGKVAHVELLGSGARVVWRQDASALHVRLPRGRPEVDYAAALKIHLT